MAIQRLSRESRQAVYVAHITAARRRASSINSRHLLFGTLSVAPRLLPNDAASLLMTRLGLGGESRNEASSADSELPFSEDARAVFGRGTSEADALAHFEVEPGHLLLALLESGDAEIRKLLHEIGVTRDQLTGALMPRDTQTEQEAERMSSVSLVKPPSD